MPAEQRSATVSWMVDSPAYGESSTPPTLNMGRFIPGVIGFRFGRLRGNSPSHLGDLDALLVEQGRCVDACLPGLGPAPFFSRSCIQVPL